MSLFDDNYSIFMEKAEAEADDAKKDDTPAEGEGENGAKADDAKKDDTPADDAKKDDTPADDAAEECGDGEKCDDTDAEELSPADAEAVKNAVEFDINADSVEEATAFDRILASEAEEAHFACLEAVSATIAFDQTDVACTEQYLKASSQYEKDLVTESFKESVKKFGARFKAFLVKIKNAIVRIFNKAVNYVRILASKVSAAFAKRVKLDKSKKVPEDATVRVCDILLKPFETVVAKIFFIKSGDATVSMGDALDKVCGLLNFGKAGNNYTYGEELRKELSELKFPTKQDIINAVTMDKGYHDVKLSTLQNDGDKFLKELDKVSDNVKVIKNWRDQMDRTIKLAENTAKKGDLSSEKLNGITACVNKAMSAFNTMIAAMVSLQSTWISQRVKIVRALNKYQGMTDFKSKDVNRFEGNESPYIKTESANLFDQFLSMI